MYDLEGEKYMNPKVKKGLIIGGLALDMLIVVFLFVISIVMLATMPADKDAMAKAIETNGKFIGYLQQNPTTYFLACVLPLILLLAGNIVLLVFYVKRASKKPAVELADLSDAEKEALKAELLKDISKDDK